MSECFYWALNMSILGSAAGLIVLALRRVRRVPRRFICALWALPAARLILPIAPQSPFSLLNLLSENLMQNAALQGTAPEWTMTNVILSAERYSPLMYRTQTLFSVFTAASVLWLAVAFAALIFVFVAYRRAMSAVRGAARLRDQLYSAPSARVPAVYGILKPKIVLPDALFHG